MHELALSESIVDIVAECSRREGLCRVTQVVLEVGEAAAVDAEALAFCFDIVTADTIAQGARLSIEKVPLRAECRQCGSQFRPAMLVTACPSCGAYGARLLQGRELRVKTLCGE